MFKVLDHTADLLIESEGTSIQDALNELLKALLQFHTPSIPKAAKEEVSIELEDTSLEDIIYSLLSKLIAMIDSRALLPLEIKLRVLEYDSSRSTPWRLKASLTVVDVKSEGLSLEGHIKAVTYHQFTVKTNLVTGKTFIRVLFDI